MNSFKRICFVLPEYKSEILGECGGVGSISKTLANSLVRKGYDVTVLVGRINVSVKTVYVEDGVRIVAFPISSFYIRIAQLLVRVFRKLRMNRFWMFLKFVIDNKIRMRYTTEFLKELESEQFDIVETSDSFGCLAKLEKSVNFLVRIHSSYSLLEQRTQNKYSNGFFSFEKANLLKSVGLIGVSNTVLSDTVNLFDIPSNIHREVIYNGVDTSLFAQSKTKTNSKRFRLIVIANIDDGKGIDFICTIANLLENNGVVYSLDIYGRGVELWNSKYKHMLNETTEHHVKYHGPVEHKEIPQILGDKDLLLHASNYESFGLTVVEAMATGVPVIVNSYPAAYEIVDDGVNGFIIDTKYENKWVEKIELLASSPLLYNELSVAARNTVKERFTISTMVEQTLNTYKRLK